MWPSHIMANVLATGHQMAKLTKEERDLEDKNVLESSVIFSKFCFCYFFLPQRILKVSWRFFVAIGKTKQVD